RVPRSGVGAIEKAARAQPFLETRDEAGIGGSARHAGILPQGRTGTVGEADRPMDEFPRRLPGLEQPRICRETCPHNKNGQGGAMRFASLVAVAWLAWSAGAFAADTVVLRAARIFDAVSGKVAEPGLVVVEGDRIRAVGADAEVPAGARVIDLGDATLLPGFIDAHVHFYGEMSDNWYRDFYLGTQRFPSEQAHYAARHARRTLEAGFTTVRDLGSDYWVAVGLRNAIDAGVVPGPRMLVSNYAVGSTAGHAAQAPFPPYLVEPANEVTGVCNGADSCRAA